MELEQMDDLSLLRARLKEMVDAKIERIAALKVEIASIETELTEAKAILGAWGAAPAPAEPEPDAARRRQRDKRAEHVVKMTLASVKHFLAAAGPQDGRSIAEHFGVSTRGTGIFGVWANRGELVRHADGRLALPPGAPPGLGLEPLPPVERTRFQ
jgi:hypothetical protein